MNMRWPAIPPIHPSTHPHRLLTAKQQSLLRRGISLLLVILLLLSSSLSFFAQPAEAADPWCNNSYCNSSWGYRRKITFNNTDANLGVTSEALTNFPVLVKLSSSNIDYSKTQSAGQDIRFTDSSGNDLAYEIEKWDSTATSFVWVKVPSISINSNTGYMYMYYGNTSATDHQQATSVWDSNYVGVWHMKDNAANTIVTESTSNVNTGTAQRNTSILTTTGQDDGALSFNGTSDYIDTGKTIGNLVSGNGTVCWWMNPATLYNDNAAHAIWGATGVSVPEFSAQKFSDNNLYIGWNSTGHDNRVVLAASAANYPQNQWIYYCFTWVPNGASTLYISGTSAGVTSSTTITSPSSNFLIGKQGSLPSYFNGKIDEVRISNAVRSAAWIAASYKSETDAFNVYGSEETPPPTPAPAGPPVCSDSSPSSAPFIYSLIPGTNSIQINFSQAGEPVSYYALEYGQEPGKYIYGATNIGGKGTTSYTVGSLSPGTSYYVRVRGGNGCATGPWSNEAVGRTLGGFFVPTAVKEKPSPTPIPTSTATPTLIPTPVASPISISLPSIRIPSISLPTVSLPSLAFDFSFLRNTVSHAYKDALTKSKNLVADVTGNLNTLGNNVLTMATTAGTVGKQIGVSGIKAVSSGVGRIATNTSNSLALAMRGIGSGIGKTGSAVTGLTANILPVTLVTKVGDYLAITAEYWFSKEPTKILAVKVEKVTPTSAVIFWQTNHHATSAVNYGFDTSYGKKVQLDERVKEHRIELTNLEPTKTYYFEVMSQNKNYVYDAYYTFKTPSEEEGTQVKGATAQTFFRKPSIIIVGNQGDWILVRNAPTKEGGVIAKVQVGETFVLLSERNGWFLISIDGKEGWIFSDFGRLAE